jgi:hypothetical protein
MTALAAWESGIRAVHAESGGLLQIHVFAPGDVGALLADALMGDATAGRLFRAINNSIKQIGAAPRRKPVLCLCCPRAIRLRDQFSIVVTVPHHEAPTRALGSALCQRCTVAPEPLMPRVVTGLRRIWPEVRAIDHIHAAGHA